MIIARKNAANQHNRMKLLYEDLLDTWFTMSGNNLLNLFALCDRQDSFNSFSLVEYLDQNRTHKLPRLIRSILTDQGRQTRIQML